MNAPRGMTTGDRWPYRAATKFDEEFARLSPKPPCDRRKDSADQQPGLRLRHEGTGDRPANNPEQQEQRPEGGKNELGVKHHIPIMLAKAGEEGL